MRFADAFPTPAARRTDDARCNKKIWKTAETVKTGLNRWKRSKTAENGGKRSQAQNKPRTFVLVRLSNQRGRSQRDAFTERRLQRARRISTRRAGRHDGRAVARAEYLRLLKLETSHLSKIEC